MGRNRMQRAACNMQLTAYNVAVAGSAFARRSRTARTLSSPSRLSRRRRSARRRSSPIRGRTDRYSENTYHQCGAACMDDRYSENTYHQCGAACMYKLEAHKEQQAIRCRTRQPSWARRPCSRQRVDMIRAPSFPRPRNNVDVLCNFASGTARGREGGSARVCAREGRGEAS